MNLFSAQGEAQITVVMKRVLIQTDLPFGTQVQPCLGPRVASGSCSWGSCGADGSAGAGRPWYAACSRCHWLCCTTLKAVLVEN